MTFPKLPFPLDDILFGDTDEPPCYEDPDELERILKEELGRTRKRKIRKK